jgi:hypothetical protein
MPINFQYPGLQSVATAGRGSQYRSGIGQQLLARGLEGDQGAYQVAAQAAAGNAALRRQALVTGAETTNAALRGQEAMAQTALTNGAELGRTVVQGEQRMAENEQIYRLEREQSERARKRAGLAGLVGGAARFAGDIWAGKPKFTPAPAAPAVPVP